MMRTPGDESARRADYLWNGTGEPDPFVARLERALEPAGKGERPLAAVLALQAMHRAGTGIRPWHGALAIAAAAVLAVTAWMLWPRNAGSGIQIVTTQGKAEVDSTALRGGRAAKAGQVITTGPESGAAVRRAGIALATLGGDSSARVVRADAAGLELELTRGSLYTGDDAGVDVGLANGTVIRGVAPKMIALREGGSAMIETKRGGAEVEFAGRITRLAHGASCRVDAERGPGIPVRAASGAAGLIGKLDEALALGMKTKEAYTLLDMTLDRAGREDAVSLWNLIGRVQPEQRGMVMNRLAELVPPPAGVNIKSAAEPDEKAMDAWWAEIAGAL